MNLRTIGLTILFGYIAFLTPVFSVHAEWPYGNYGWKSLVSEIVGDDASCGADMVKQELYLRDLETGNPVSFATDRAFLGVGNLSDGSITNVISGTGPTISSVCYNPSTEYLAFDIDGGTDYYNFYSLDTWVSPGAIPRGKLMRTTVWLEPTTAGGGANYIHNAPSNVIVNQSPSFEIDLNSFPSTYGATGLSKVNLFVLNVVGGKPTTLAINKTISVTGGTGTKVVPPQTLADGSYAWSEYLSLNGSHNAGGLSLINELVSGLPYDNYSYFILDTTAPTIDVADGHIPTAPDSLDTVGITATATDALSGVDEIRIYVDAVLAETCAYASVSSAACNVSVGPYAAGTTHEYYAIATDAAGNVRTGVTHSFTVEIPQPDLVTGNDISPMAATILTPVTFSSSVQNIGGVSTDVGFTVLFQKVLDPDTAKDADIGTYATAALGAGITESTSLTYTFPAEDADTIQYVRTCADQSTRIDTGVIAESDENNCGGWVPVTVAGLPDVVAASSTVSSGTVNAGDTITFRTGVLTYPYQATYPVTMKFPHAGFYVDTNNDGTSEYTAQIPAPGPSGSLGAWLNQNRTVAWTVPANAPSGTYRVGYIANDPAAFSEVTYANNWSGWTTFEVIGNELPTANAGPDKTIELPITTSAPSGVLIEDTEGMGFKDYYWNFVSGPGVSPTIVGGDTLSPTFTNLTQAGQYIFRLSVFDALWATGTDEMQVTVNEDPSPTGWITATPNTVDAIDTSTITWGSSNADECVVTSTQNADTWTQLNNGDGEVTSPLTADISYVLTCDSILVASAPIRVNPDVTITASSRVVQNDGFVDITWNTNGNDEAFCSLSGGGLSNELLNGTGTGTYRVPNITAKTKFTITCGTQTDSVDVEVKPIGWES